jgi:hypothetical protein
VEDKTRMPVELQSYLRMLGGGVVVEDDVHELSGWHLRFDGVEKADEPLMPMALHASHDVLAFKHIESGEQRRCPVALVVVGRGAGAALLHRQAGLDAVECQDLRLLIDREHDRVGGRIDIEPDNVAQLSDEPGVVGQPKAFHPVRLKAVRPPDALDRTRANTDGFRHHRGRPVGCLGGRVGLGERHDVLGDVCSQRRDARGSRLITQQAVVAHPHEAFLQAPRTGLRLSGPAHDLVGAEADSAQQDDLCPPDVPMRRIAIPRECGQTAAINRLECDGNSGSRPPDSHASSQARNPSKFQISDLIH